VEASTIEYRRAGRAVARGRTPLLRMASDERLVVFVRRGNHAAFDALVARYNPRLLSFCRHMLRSREDAEDVLQDVFASAFKAMMADERPIVVRPWLYRIARNRCLNHLRRISAIGVESIEDHVSEHEPSASEAATRREELWQLVDDIRALPEQQRAALLLRELEALSYEEISVVLDKTIPSVKSLLIRARRALAERAEARGMTCEEAALELAEAQAGGRDAPSRPVRWHLEQCVHCTSAEKSNSARRGLNWIGAFAPLAPLVALRRALLASGPARAGSGAAGAGASSGAAAIGSQVLAGSGGVLSAGVGGIAAKAAAGLAAAAIGVAGAVSAGAASHRAAATTAVAPAPPASGVAAITHAPRVAARALGRAISHVGGPGKRHDSAAQARPAASHPPGGSLGATTTTSASASLAPSATAKRAPDPLAQAAGAAGGGVESGGAGLPISAGATAATVGTTRASGTTSTTAETVSPSSATTTSTTPATGTTSTTTTSTTPATGTTSTTTTSTSGGAGL
jgi:RNA polymerase sigma factor (sigma-70 family)